LICLIFGKRQSCAELWYNIACQKLGVFTP